MEGMGLKFTSLMGDISYAIQARLGLCLAILGPIAIPNSPNGTMTYICYICLTFCLIITILPYINTLCIG